jgi:hypothetical protein
MTGGKMLTGAGEDDHFDLFIQSGLLEGAVELFQQPG